jgi:GTP-binding protein
MSGRAGKDVYIKVPVGTTVYDAETEKIIVDILSVGQEFVICKGGKGGYGNAFFKSSFNKVPTLHENGDLGETKEILLKIRYIADVGIVGFPNAGKSTLINLISNAKPKIANYQFTTITPVLGVVKNKGKELIFADMPGLIKGASSGKGLGHEFLKHIERCYVLIHLVSLDPNDNEDVLLSIKQINDELKKYSKILLNKNIILVASKADTE